MASEPGRRLSEEQKRSLVKLLEQGRGTFTVTVSCQRMDEESWAFAGDFLEVFKRAGWKVNYRHLNDCWDFGLWVGVDNVQQPAPGAALLLRSLEEAGVLPTYNALVKSAFTGPGCCWLEVGVNEKAKAA